MTDPRGSRKGLIRSWYSASTSMGTGSGSALTASVLIAGRPIVGIVMPEVWSPQASMTFDVSACPGGTFYPLYDCGKKELVLTVAASTAIAGSVLDFLQPWYGFRIRSGSAVADADDQIASRVFIIYRQG